MILLIIDEKEDEKVLRKIIEALNEGEQDSHDSHDSHQIKKLTEKLRKSGNALHNAVERNTPK
jgi:hypothetical protein